MKNAILEVENDPINSLTVKGYTTPGNTVKLISIMFLDKAESQKSEFGKVAEETVIKIFNIIKLCDVNKENGREQLWSKMHNVFVNDSAEFDIWKILMVDSQYKHDSSEFKIFLHSVWMKLFYIIMKFENERKIGQTKIPDVKLTNEEQQVVYYVGGYIVFSLQKKYKGMMKNGINPVAVAAYEFLESLKDSHKGKVKTAQNFLDFVKKWSEVSDRGGVTYISTDMFIFIRRIENVVRSVLNLDMLKRYNGEDLRELIQTELEKHSLIDEIWDTISRNIGNEKLKSHLKQEIITRWVDIRAKAYVNAYVQIVKRRLNNLKSKDKETADKVKKLSAKGEPAMRKTLS